MLRIKKSKSTSTLGKLIDTPLKDFKKYLESEHINIGTMNNLIFYLNDAYADLRQRKDTLIKSLENPDITYKDRKLIQKSIKGIFVELIKIEEKVVYLQDRVKELIDVEDKIDTTNQ